MKKEILDELGLYTQLDTIINGSLKEAAENILALEKRLYTENDMVIQNPDKYIRFNIKVENDYDEYAKIRLFGVRMETDKEFKKRIEENRKKVEAQKASAKKRIENNDEKELATFIRLQKKYANR